jgi:hypothetical protein
MAALVDKTDAELCWVTGALGLHEECAAIIADPIIRFLNGASS